MLERFEISLPMVGAALAWALTIASPAAAQRAVNPSAGGDHGNAWHAASSALRGAEAAVDGGRRVSVRFDALREAASSGGTLALPLPDGRSVLLAVSWVDAESDQAMVAGPLVDAQGEASITVAGNSLVARIVADGRLYMVRQVPGSPMHTVTEVDTKSLPPEGRSLQAPAPAEPPSPVMAGEAAADTNAFVDLMILYSPNARAMMGSASAITLDLIAAVNNANVALANSGVAHRLRLVHLAEIPYVENGNSSTALERLTFANDGHLDSVQALRDQYGADLVTLVTTDPDYCGIAWVMGPNSVNASFEWLGYSVVNYSCANANLSLAHEIGHNMGLQHDRPNASNTPSHPYAYGFAVPGVARDVMAYPCASGCPRSAVFSTPLFNFPYYGMPAGTADEDSARALNNTSTVVANFRQQKGAVPTLSASPSSGVGSSGTFVLRYATNLSSTAITSAWAWFHHTLSAGNANSCMVRVDPVSGRLWLLDDAGTAWTEGWITSGILLTNSQCVIGARSIARSGGELSISLAVTFTSGFAGAKNVYMWGSDGVTESGWQDRGDWTVPGVPQAQSVSPSSGSGASQVFDLVYSDSGGASALTSLFAQFRTGSASIPGPNSCAVSIAVSTGTVSLLADDGAGSTSGVLGTSATLQNSQCAVQLGGSSMTAGGATQTVRLSMLFKPTYAGSKNVVMRASNQHVVGTASVRGSWTVPGDPLGVTADSATPSSGSGAAQSFALQYSDSIGAAAITTAWVWFTEAFEASSARSCMAYAEPATNTIRLLNDAGTAWSAATLGGSGTLQNSQCAIALANSHLATSGTALTVTLAMTFKPAYSGAKEIFMYAADGTMNSGWKDRGDWTVPAPVPGVTATSVSPANGSGASQVFTLQYADGLGAANLTQAWAWFSQTLAASAARSCLLYVDRPANTVWLLDDGGTTWLPGTLGGGSVLQNSQCAIALSGSGVAANGTTLSVTVAMTFKPAFAGARNVYLFATNGVENSGWHDRGDWTVPAPAAGVTVTAVSPADGSGTSQVFTLQYADGLGAVNLAQAWAWFNQTLAASAARSCLLYVDRPANTVWLLDDGGTTWMPGTLGGGGVLQNSQCAIALSNSGLAANGATLSVTVAMTFKPAFAGAKNVYLYATNGAENSGWHDRGDWTVPASATGVTTSAVLPANGSGTSQVFTLQYADGLGATNLTQAWVWFNQSFAATAANSCLLYVDRPANTVWLLNDGGTTWMPGTLGGGGVLQNGQCAIALSGSGLSANAATLSVTVALTFKPAFAGAKNIYLYATDGIENSGWHDRGDWVVP